MVEKVGRVSGHTAVIYDRGGRQRYKQGVLLDLGQVKWERTRDGVSEASVQIIPGCVARQEEFLAELRTHRHEMVIFRGSKRVWEGPLHRISDDPLNYEIVAHDVAEYLFYQPLTRTYSNASPNVTEVTTRIGDIIEYELTHGRTVHVGGTPGVDVMVPAWEALTPPINLVPNLVIHHWPNEARTAMTTDAFSTTVGDHLTNLARQSGIDYTAVGRALHIWDTSRSLGRGRQLTEEDFGSRVIVTEYGADHTQIGIATGMDGAYGQAVNTQNLDYYGPWTTVYSAYDEDASQAPTQAELNSQAARNVSGRSPAPIEVRVPDNSTITLDDTLTIEDLVPGVQFPLLARLNARKISQLQKLDHVVVKETADGETVQVTMTPATRPDSDMEA